MDGHKSLNTLTRYISLLFCSDFGSAGTTRTWIEKVATAAPTTNRTNAFHRFFRVDQPIDEDNLPGDRIAKAGVTYKHPFTFVVPDRLLPHVCTHETVHRDVKDAHLRLPPSFGDAMVASNGGSLLNDLAPEMTRISWAIRVSISRRKSDGKLATIANCAKKVRIIPAIAEEPPMNIRPEDDDYVFRVEKTLRKGLLDFGPKIGRMTVEAAQPMSLHLPPPTSEAAEANVTTTVTIKLRFDPLNADSKPPKLGQLISKLKVYTFFGTKPWTLIARKSPNLYQEQQLSVFTDSVNLSGRNVANVDWEEHASIPSGTRRVSASMVEVIPVPSSNYQGGKFFTAKIVVPVTLPKDKSWVPTFHSCLVSRTYAVKLDLSYQTPGANLSAPTVHLKVPVQISSRTDQEAPTSLTDAHMLPNMFADEIETDFFSPGNDAPPSPEYLPAEVARPGRERQSVDAGNNNAPPEYSFLGTAPSRRGHRGAHLGLRTSMYSMVAG